ncbi:MAG: BrnA antitoxin family protein [Rhodopila sp.]|jgi:uncharacterized protein (DUF4415 family)
MAKIKLNPEDYDDKPIDDEENPELTEEDFARGKPFKEVFPKQYAEWKASGRAPMVKRIGRPPVDEPKVHIGFRLAPDVVASIRATGKGYNARVEKVLREAIQAGRL